MTLSEKRLRSRGWSEKDIRHVKKVVGHQQPHFLEKISYWIILFVVLIGTIMGLWLIAPFLIILPTKGALIILSMIGLIFGLFTGVLVSAIEETKPPHHVIISLSIPLTAIITSTIISHKVSLVASQQNPYLLATTYSLSVLIPYGIFMWIQGKKNESY